MIERSKYLEILKANQDRDIIKVVTGVRRSGKSTLFTLFIDHLLAAGVNQEQVIFINLEDLANEELLDYHKLYDHIVSRLLPEGTTYIFIDEIQSCTGFEKVVDSLFIRKGTDIYITGSNAHMLSGELATLLSGRYITIEVLPFSFREFTEAKASEQKDRRTLFDDYMRDGSFPYLASSGGDEQVVKPYLEGLFHTILIKDIASREQVSDIQQLENIVKVLASSVGSPISIKRICDTLVSAGRPIALNTVSSYVKALTDSYLFYQVARYDVRGRQFLRTNGKYYLVDSGIRNHLLTGSSSDLGHIIENIVYLELRRRYGKVNIGKLDKREIDFVAVSPSETAYYQVTATMMDEKTAERELAPLRKIRDNHRKIVLSLDEFLVPADYDGIKHLNLIDWLLEEDLRV